ncbi:L-threonylcarbamoyladenylate synthase [Capnocytophaga felis]|uniref:L-threonylcarbamoyladenylate synthase n=1 Tax=Capnocytophaga felis TaxID=2267611 RepID=A0A5M4B586_9FLAO|nr:L-threonylcarbamoyladenylate synthase [Capnocytophaga felis]GET44764.1 threonylcarbamoyl-AMP synthase [Capnocytophaga felis]GET48709.1 threonylcarbamoyl-AMP synthase [Capnocytophaga felis]
MDSDIKKSTETLINEGVILYPTDTVWGLGCDATNVTAVSKIFGIKQRNESKSLIILVDSVEMLQKYISEIPNFVLNFLKTVQNPTTIIYSNPKNLAKNVISSENTVAIRLIQDDFCQKLIQNFGKPIVSTSANISGEPTPHIFSDVNSYIIEKCDYVVKHRQNDTEKRNPSQLVRFDSEGNIEFLR